MPNSLDISKWRAATRAEVLAFLQKDRPSPKKRQSNAPSKRTLIVRTFLKPVDVYTYLRARFGIPNGFQNILRKDDSDNWIHWDYNIKADATDVYFSGTSRSVHITLSEDLSDHDWWQLIQSLKADFARFGAAKSAVARSLEKYLVFQNKFVALSDLCADAHAAIVDATPRSLTLPTSTTSQRALRKYYSKLNALTKRARALYGHCLTLRLLTPVMAESFLNMMIVTFCRAATHNDKQTFAQFIRAKIPQRIAMLTLHCDGFAREVDTTTPSYGDFLRVMNSRNFSLHGNVDPVRERIETVYFEGTRPLFVDGGDNVIRQFEHLEQLNRPSDVVRDYEAVHAFLYELTTYLSPEHQRFFEQVITDPYPGYEVRKKRITRILPNHSVSGYILGLRYDDELEFDRNVAT